MKNARTRINWPSTLAATAACVLGGFSVSYGVYSTLPHPGTVQEAAAQASEVYGVQVRLVRAEDSDDPSTFSVGSADPVTTRCTWKGLGSDDFFMACGGADLDPATLYAATR